MPYKHRNVFIFLASLFFCFCWNWITGIVFIFQIAITYLSAYNIDKSQDSCYRKRWYISSVVVLLFVLLLFKYVSYATKTLFPGHASFLEKLPPPVGISFYTFMGLGYLYDIYRGYLKFEQPIGLFVSTFAFFPHFASGPIGRYADISNQLQTKHSCIPEQLALGGRLILWGLFKKVVIADRLAQFTAPVFSAPQDSSGFTCLVAMYFYSIQIYCDFSGYSDIAIGSAKLMGFNLQQNFKLPYFAESIYDFWKRWHISLTSWFRDYLYIPLGGNRVGTFHWIINIMLVFLVSGIWHGASWTFAIWGGLHGIVYLIELFIKRIFICHLHFQTVLSKIIHPFKILVTFHIVSIAWVFFRSSNMSNANRFLENILFHFGSFNWGSSKIPTLLSFALIIFLVFAEILMTTGWSGDYFRPGKCPEWLKYLGYGTLLMAIALLGVRSESFIYFQF